MKGNNNDALKKHHFWILAGLAPLLVLLAVIFLMTGVSGAIEKKVKEVGDNEKTVSSAKAPGTGMLRDLDSKKEKLGKVRGDLWKINWDKQATYFTWPETSQQIFDKYNTMKFGSKHRDFIQDQGLGEKLKPAYLESYEKLGNSIAPTKMKGGWQSVLKWVNNWGQLQPESQQLWIVMEDIWMQRALLGPISAVNQAIAELKPVPPLNDPKKRKFVSRIWEMDLEIANKDGSGGGRVLKGKLKNRTGQLQVLGVGSAMRVHVWFDPKATDLPPFEFRIEGAGVAGGESIDIPPLPSHVLPPNLEVLEIAKVVQVLDARTVPIRRLDRLAIGYLSSKDFSKELKVGTYWVETAAAPATTGSTGGGSESSGMPSNASSDIGGGGGFGNPSGGATAASTGVASGRAGGMRLMDVADGSRKRYLEVTEQLRRVPVAFTLVVDQMYVNDVIIAYANSALRFETSQVHWSRFGESLAEPGAGGGGSSDPSGSGSEPFTATGFTGAGLSMPSGAGGFAGSSSRGSTGGDLPVMGSGSFKPGGMSGGIPGLGADTLSSVSEAQANAGLVQLTIYGLVTLYERYDAPKVEGGATTEPTPAPDAPKPDAPAPDAPKADAPKVDPAKPDAPKTDAPKTDAPKADPAKPDVPKTDAPKADPAKPDAPKTDAPKTPEKK